MNTQHGERMPSRPDAFGVGLWRRLWRGAAETTKARVKGLSEGTATGIRTPVSAVRGRRPSPLDDSGRDCVRQGSERRNKVDAAERTRTSTGVKPTGT